MGFDSETMATSTTALVRQFLDDPRDSAPMAQLIHLPGHHGLWESSGGKNLGWWSHAVAFSQAVISGDHEQALLQAEKGARDALSEAGEAGLIAAMLLLPMRACVVHKERFSFLVEAQTRIRALPSEITALISVLIENRRRYLRDEIAVLHSVLEGSRFWNSPVVRLTVRNQQWQLFGNSRQIADDVWKDLHAFPRNAELWRFGVGLLALQQDRTRIAAMLAHILVARQEAEVNPAVAETWVDLQTPAPIPASVEALAKIMRDLREGWHNVTTLLRQSSSIAVVGNSAIERGRLSGKKIDDHETVIRINQFDCSDAFSQDYGKKTDLVIATNLSETLQSLEYERRNPLIILAKPIEPRLRLPKDLNTALASQFRVALLPDGYTQPLRRLTGSSPSTGLLLTFILKQLGLPIERSSFFGFSFVDQLLKGASSHYFEQSVAHEIHDWTIEKAIFESMFSFPGSATVQA